MDIIYWILEKLNGKKATIVSLVALTISFSQLQGWISSDWSVYLNSVLVILSGGANITNYLESKKYEVI